jgi:hypothetical protein
MGKTPMWRRYLTFWGRDIDRDLREEVAFHIEARTRELLDAGWPPDAAAAEARRQFGSHDAILSECHQIDVARRGGNASGRVRSEPLPARICSELDFCPPPPLQALTGTPTSRT